MDQKLTTKTYEIDKIRADFPILAREVYGKPLTYLDNGASAQKAQMPCLMPSPRPTRKNMQMFIAGCIFYPMRQPMPMKARAKVYGVF